MLYSRIPARLASLTELTHIAADRAGSEGFSQELVTDAEALLRRSGERMRMSASHTVVALAGGTGSGKSSLFNALAGAAFSPAGVMRPTTKHLHACVWGMEGAAPLLDWLSVQRRHRYGRASARDSVPGGVHWLARGGAACLGGAVAPPYPSVNSTGRRAGMGYAKM